MKTLASALALAAALAGSAAAGSDQLARSTELSPSEAATLSLSDLAALKFTRDGTTDDRPSIRSSAAPASDALIRRPGDDEN